MAKLGCIKSSLSGYFIFLLGSVITETNFSSFDAISLGFGAHFHKTINENLTVNIGANYNLKTELEGTHDRISVTNIKKAGGAFIVDTVINENVNRGVLELPQSFNFGTSVLLKQKLEVAFDYKLEQWYDTKIFGKAQNFRENEQYSLGFEFSPDLNSTKYFKLIKYRAGVNLTNSYLVVQEKRLKDIGASIGFAFPLRRQAIINLSASYNRRFVPGLDILKENIFQIHLNLSFRANWFIKSKFY